MNTQQNHTIQCSGKTETEFPIPMPAKFCRLYETQHIKLNHNSHTKNIPAEIAARINEAIIALAQCQGLEQKHINTILLCSKNFPNEFESAYFSYFESSNKQNTPFPI